jgi:hypothetical protein
MLILSEAHLRAVLIEYQAHYNTAPGIRASPRAFPAMSAKFPASRQSTSMSSESAEDPY